MKCIVFRMTCVALLATAMGCGGTSAPPPSDDEAIAETKAQITAYAAAVQESPKSPEANAGILLESMQARVDQYGEQFQPLVAETEALHRLQQNQAPKAEIETQLQKLQAAAEKL